MASYLDIKNTILERINGASNPEEKKELYIKLYRLNEAYSLFDQALDSFGKEIEPDNWEDAQANKGSDMSGSEDDGDGVDNAYGGDNAVSGEGGGNQNFDEEINLNVNLKKKRKKKKVKNFSLSLEPQPPNPDGQLAYGDIEHEDDIEDYACHIPEEHKWSGRYVNEANGLSYELGKNGKWSRIINTGEVRQNLLHEGTPFFDEKTQIAGHSFYVVPGEQVSEGLKIKAGEGRNYRIWSGNSGHIWIKDGNKGTWHRSVNRFHKKSDAQAAFEEIRKWKPTQEEDTQATWEEFAENKEKQGYLYNGKVYKRCPKGTTGSGKTCVPKDLKEGKDPKRKSKKKKTKTDKQIELLAKAKSQKDIERARKANRKTHDSKTK